MDQELDRIRMAVSGDSDAFIVLADSMKRRLYHTAYVMLGAEADACDAVDEALYNAFRHIRTLREPRFFTTWLTRILINQCNQALRRRKRETVIDTPPNVSEAHTDTLPIRDAVARLPDELRVVISLRYFSDMTVPAVAETLNLPQGTVKSRQRKALSLLRVELGDE